MKILKDTNVLFVGPMPPPVTGQSISFRYTVEVIDCNRKIVIDQNLEGKKVLVKLYKTFSVVWLYAWYFLTKKFGIVYFTNTRSLEGSLKDLVLISLAKIFRKKIISHVHGAELQAFIDSLPAFYRNLIQWAYRQIDCHVILLQGMREQLLFLQNEAMIETVPNFYDPGLDEFHLQRSVNGSINIGYFSNILFSKGVIDLITAFKSLNASNPRLHLKIAGDFRADEIMTESEVRTAVTEAINGHASIEYFGDINGREKADFLSSVDIFVLPTFYKSEAFPISIVEAMRCGAIIITTNHNYLQSLLVPESGSLVPVNDPAAIELAINKYVSDPLLMKNVSKFNSEKAKKNFSITAYSKTMNSIFSKVAAMQ